MLFYFSQTLFEILLRQNDNNLAFFVTLSMELESPADYIFRNWIDCCQKLQHGLENNKTVLLVVCSNVSVLNAIQDRILSPVLHMQ